MYTSICCILVAWLALVPTLGAEMQVALNPDLMGVSEEEAPYGRDLKAIRIEGIRYTHKDIRYVYSNV